MRDGSLSRIHRCQGIRHLSGLTPVRAKGAFGRLFSLWAKYGVQRHDWRYSPSCCGEGMTWGRKSPVGSARGWSPERRGEVTVPEHCFIAKALAQVTRSRSSLSFQVSHFSFPIDASAVCDLSPLGSLATNHIDFNSVHLTGIVDGDDLVVTGASKAVGYDSGGRHGICQFSVDVPMYRAGCAARGKIDSGQFASRRGTEKTTVFDTNDVEPRQSGVSGIGTARIAAR